MLASQILSDVRRELLEYGTENFWSDAELLRHLNRGQLDFINRTRLLENSAFMTLQQGRTDYQLPADCSSVRLVFHNIPDTNGNAHWHRIYPSNLEKIAQENPSFLDTSVNVQARPVKYYIWNSVLNVVPAPNLESATTLYLFYKSKVLPITDPATQHISIDEALSEALIAYVLWKAWAKEKELDLAEAQKQVYYEYIGEGRRWLKRQSGDQRFRIDLDSPISFYDSGSSFSPFR